MKDPRAAYGKDKYWGKPVPPFGDPDAKLVIVGLAPAAHGANRTGRMFTGDRSGEWLYRALHKAGFANQSSSTRINDGLKLIDAVITATVRCAPPDNKPTKKEILNCQPYLSDEINLHFKNARVYLALGGIAYDELYRLFKAEGHTPKIKPKFKHGLVVKLGNGKQLICSYHPSQQNTFTGRLTEPMFDSIFSVIMRQL